MIQVAEELSAITDALNRWLDPMPRRGTYLDLILKTLPHIQCSDGFTMSVQAGRGLHCSPRNNDGPWTAVEVGFPSAKSDLLMDYAEDSEKPTDTVYGYVPITTVARVILEHGGFAP